MIMKYILLAIPLLLAVVACSDESPTVSDPPAVSTIRVPADEPTIQAAIDASTPSGTVILSDGVYTGPGNRDINFNGKSIKLRSENGPTTTIIDCAADSLNPHRAFSLISQENAAVIEGITIRNGYFNEAAGIQLQNASPRIEDCVFENNIAGVSGGAIRCKGASPLILNCTFIGNEATVGGGIYLIGGSTPVIENCLFAFNAEGGAVYPNEGTSIPTLLCCNLYGNEFEGGNGNYFERVADQDSLRGNLSLDPNFCNLDISAGLSASSPCLPANNSCGKIIGAIGQGCP